MNMNTISSFIDILKNSTNEQEINHVTQQARTIYINAANKTTPTKILNSQNNNHKNKKQVTPQNNNKKWYNKECKTLKRQLNSIRNVI